MPRTVASYLALLKSLLPRGAAWSRTVGTMPQLLEGSGQELARVDALIESLLTERDTRYADALLAEHETELGLPEEGQSLGATEAARRLALHAKFVSVGGQTKAYFIAVAAGMGYTITIDEFTPFWCGIARCGDPVGGQKNLFYWRVNVQYDRTNPGATGADLQLVLERLKPAHTVLLFRVVAPEFSNAFSFADFNAMPAADLTVGAFSRYDFSADFDVRYGGSFSKEFSEDFEKVF